MLSMRARVATLATALLLCTASSIVTATPTQADRALITPPPTVSLARRPDHIFQYQRRDALSSLTAEVASYGRSILSGFGSAIPSYVTNGILPNMVNLPTGSQVLSSANVSSTDVAAQPTQVLNIPGYANWTGSQWNLRVHGNVFKQPVLTNETVDKLANLYLIDTSVAQLNNTQQQDQARNLTRSIYVVQQPKVNVTVNILPSPQFGGDGEPNGGGGVTGQGINQTTTLPYATTDEGDFDAFIPLDNSSSLRPGNGVVPPQRVNVFAQGTTTGNATSYLVSDNGLTVISDIDDILRVTKIYQPKEGLLNSFARPFVPWQNMPAIYANWSRSIPTMHFHYLTTTPEQVTRPYMDFIYKTYPGGSFDTRPLNFSDVSATLSIRKYLLDRIFQTYPNRKFILVADTSNSDVMRDYPKMAQQYPGQVQCIFLRNTSASDPGDRFPYDTAGFKNLNTNSYMFFVNVDDLTNLDIEGGHCLNASVKQNVTFNYQGLPLGLSNSNVKGEAPKSQAWNPFVVVVPFLLGAAAVFSGL